MASKRKAREYDCSSNLIEVNPMDVRMKTVSANVSPCVVGVASFGICEEVAHHKDKIEVVEDKFSCSGIIIECEDVGDGRFFSTILTLAILFKHNGLEPKQVKVYVYFLDNKYKGKLLACDFHYNLAAIRIQSDSPLKAATLRSLNDILPIDVTQHLQLFEEEPFVLHPHSKLYRIFPGTNIITLWRPCTPQQRSVQVASGVCCVHSVQFSSLMDCNELFWIECLQKCVGGGPVCNYLGEVIGISFDKYSFLPINIVMRWWDHFRSYRGFRRPWLGFKVANLHTACLHFLQQFSKEFPDVSTGVIVIKIAKDSPAYLSGIRPNDVIVRCANELVRSKMEFFENIWEKAGKSVELTVLRVSDGSQFYPSINIDETVLGNFYGWRIPIWWRDERSKRRKVIPLPRK